MSATNSVVAVYDTHEQAEKAIKALQVAGVEMKCLSIVGRNTHTDEHVVGYYNAGDRMKYWGSVGAFWGGFWGLLFGSAASSPRVVKSVALLLQSVMKRIRTYANDPDLNFYVHDAPLSPSNYRRRDYRYHHWHIEVIPKMATAAGFELSTWIDINTVDPNHAAAILRGKR